MSDEATRGLEWPTERALAGDVEGALTELRARALESPEDDAVWATLGTILSSVERWSEASTALHRAVELAPEVLATRLSLARALAKLGKLDDAVFQLRQAEKLNAHDVRPLKELGVLLYQKGLYEKAIAVLGRARALEPNDPRVWYALGLTQEARHDPGAAIAAYRQAITLDPRFVDAHKTLVDLLASMGEHQQAISVLDEVLRLERTNERAAQNREVLQKALAEMHARRLLGKPEKALMASALLQEGKLQPQGRVQKSEEDGPAVANVERYASGLVQLLVGVTEDGRMARLMLLLPNPEKAAAKRDTVFRVTVVGTNGKREPANYATAVTLTFLREVLGAPMTQASALYARLLGGEASLDWNDARLEFASVHLSGETAAAHGLSVQTRGFQEGT